MPKNDLPAILWTLFNLWIFSLMIVPRIELAAEKREVPEEAINSNLKISEESAETEDLSISNVLIHFKPDEEISLVSVSKEVESEASEQDESFEAFKKNAEKSIELTQKRLSDFESELTINLTQIFKSSIGELEGAQADYERSLLQSLPVLPPCEMDKGSHLKPKTNKRKNSERTNTLTVFFGTEEQFAKSETGGIFVEFILEGVKYRLKNPFSKLFIQKFNVECIPTAIFLDNAGNIIKQKRGAQAYVF